MLSSQFTLFWQKVCGFLKAQVFGTDCLICKLPQKAPASLCLECKEDLPWLMPGCIQCAHPLDTTGTHLYCGQCISRPPAFDKVYAVFAYEKLAAAFINQLKFSEELIYARVLGELLAEKVIHKWYQEKTLPQLLIPMPLHAKRTRQRGFNQSLELTKSLNKKLRLPIAFHQCQRVKFTQPQSQLSKQARIRNVKNAFIIRKPISAEHVAIIDDVVTTGNTISELAKVLKENGVKRVDVWCVARAIIS